MANTLKPATLENILMLMKKRLNDFSGESRRSYSKAFSSFQYFVVGNYLLSEKLNQNIVENWVIDNRLQSLTEKTTSFYLDKVASLYGAVADKVEGGKSRIYKEVKAKLKDNSFPRDYGITVETCVKKIRNYYKSRQPSALDSYLNHSSLSPLKNEDNLTKTQWACFAIRSGIPSEIIASILGNIPEPLKILEICSKIDISDDIIKETQKTVRNALINDNKEWFAMRLRPGVSYDSLIERFSKLTGVVKMPELFYPCEEIAVRVGKKIVWTGKPIIKDVVFFKYCITEIYSLFTHIYDLAWCYRNPGSSSYIKYASIPTKYMEDFKNAIGFLRPGYEIKPAGEMDFKPGDEVVIVNGDFAENKAKILKNIGSEDENSDSGQIYRVVLLDKNGKWEIGIDARWIKKV